MGGCTLRGLRSCLRCERVRRDGRFACTRRSDFFLFYLAVCLWFGKDEGVGSRGGCRNNPVASFMPMALIEPGLLYIQEG